MLKRTCPALLIIGLFLSSAGPGCGIEETIDRQVDKTTRVLDDGIRALDQNSGQWQQVLKDMEGQLTDDVQSTLRNEVDTLLKRAIAAGGSELRCTTDFIGKRVLQALRRLKAELFGGHAPVALEPAICSVTPMAVDVELVRTGRLRSLEIYGYDFDTSRLKLLLIESNGTIDQSAVLAQPSHYQMTIPFGSNGVKLSERSQKLQILWNDQVQSTISIIQPTTQVCKRELREIFPMPGSTTLVPPHTNGDREFGGKAEIWLTCDLTASQAAVSARVYMKAYEPKEDHTTAEGSTSLTLYTVPPGMRLRNLLTPRHAEHHYIDDDHTLDEFAGSGPVLRWKVVGDTAGDEAGSRTQVTVDFLSRFQVELEQTTDCVPPQTLWQLRDQGYLSEETAAALRLDTALADTRD